MKNSLKKYLSLFLVIAMLFSNVTVFAEGNNKLAEQETEDTVDIEAVEEKKLDEIKQEGQKEREQEKIELLNGRRVKTDTVFIELALRIPNAEDPDNPSYKPMEEVNYIIKDANTGEVVAEGRTIDNIGAVELPYGDYISEVINPDPDKYVATNDYPEINSWTLPLPEEIAEVITYYERHARKLELIKRDDTTQLYITIGEATGDIPVVGAEFNVYSSRDDKLVGQGVTNKQGTIIFDKDIEFNAAHYFVETKAPEGFLRLKFKQPIPGDSNSMILFNDRILSKLSITKVDSITKEPIKDVEFKLYFQNENWLDENEETREFQFQTFDGQSIFKTDQEGVINIPEIMVGKYRVEEVSTPEGYELLPEDYIITIDCDYEKDINEDFVLDEFGNKIPVEGTQNNVTIENVKTVKGTKTWDDNNNQDGKRPDSIKVNLVGNGEIVDSKVLTTANASATDANVWEYEFTGFETHDADGKAKTFTVTENEVDGYTTVIDGYDITNSYTPGKTSVTVNKVWEDANNQDGKRPTEITVQLLADGKEVEEKTESLNEANNWTVTFEGLDEKVSGEAIVYTVVETDVPAGYKVSYVETGNTITVTNDYTTEIIPSIEGMKTWDDNNNQDGKRPESITVNLLANNEKVEGKSVSVTGPEWKYSFENLPKYKDGKEIVYTVSEEAVSDYQVSYDGMNITNSYTPGKTSVTVNKVWEDANNQDGKRPTEITVQLLADGKEVEGKTESLNEANNWTVTFEGLDEKVSGEAIVYTVVETDVPAGYKVSYVETGNTITVTNDYTTEIIPSIEGMKTWDDNNNQDGKRPESITVNLLADNVKVEGKSVVVTEAEGWKYSFENLPKYKDGKEIAYTVSEETVEGYTTTYDGMNITNSYTPGKTSVTVNKVWEDTNNQDGKRPTEITVQLLANGTEVAGKTATLNADNNWSTTFTDLDLNAGGKEVVYSVKEVVVPEGYTSSVGVIAEGIITVTNSYDAEIIPSIEGIKTWDDNNNQDGKRPESITVNLLADNVKVEGKSVSVTGPEWKYSFENLPKYKDGKEIVYTVSEEAVADYQVSYDGMNITNKYTPGQIEIKGSKTWDHKNNPVADQPTEVTIILKADGIEVERKVVTATEDWKYDFGIKATHKDGKKINYTIDELDIKDYVKAVDGFNITNTYNVGAPKLVETKSNNTTNNKVEIGDKFKYTITVKNNGNADATNVKISDDVPKQLDILGVDPKAAKITGQLVEYTVPTIKAGEIFTMTIEVKVNDTAKKGDTFINVAYVNDIKVPDREIEVVTPPTYPWIWGGDFDRHNHYAYMVGYPDGTVRPQGEITRGEVVTIFFRMMTDESRERYWSTDSRFNDVKSSDWYNNAISTMRSAGAIEGYGDGTFLPDSSITRGEFAAMASRFLADNGNLTNYKFTDIKGNWAESAINKLASHGLINGYPDGSFKPNQVITRAEAATLVNAILERTPHKDKLLKDMKTWPDNADKDEWYYAHIQEATNSHEYERANSEYRENWTKLLPVRDWVAMEQEWSTANSSSNPGNVTK